MTFVHMANEVCWNVVDVSALNADVGGIYMMFVHMVNNVCQSAVDISTLGADVSDICMMFVHMGMVEETQAQLLRRE